MGSLGFAGPGFQAQAVLSGSFPVSVVAPTPVNPPVEPYQGNAVAFAPHLQLPYTLQWNATIEQSLGKSQAFIVSYLGAHASRLLRTDQISPPANANVRFLFAAWN